MKTWNFCFPIGLIRFVSSVLKWGSLSDTRLLNKSLKNPIFPNFDHNYFVSAHGLQELLKSITQSKSTDAKSNADNKRNSSVGQSKLPSQVSEQNSGASDLISLLQSSNRRNPSSTLQGQMHNSIQTVQSHQVQQPAFAWNHPTTMQQVVYVRPLGQGLNTNIAKQEPSQFLSIPFSPSSHSSVSFLNSSVIRGLSPQKNSRCLNYPSYLQMYQSKMDNHPMQQSVPNMSGNGPSNATPAKSNATASISSVKRNLEDVMNGDQRTSLGVGSKRVRMGWSPTKHTSSMAKKFLCITEHWKLIFIVLTMDLHRLFIWTHVHSNTYFWEITNHILENKKK